MTTENTEFEGGEDVPTPDKEYATAMEQLLNESTAEQFGMTISGVLEFLTMRAYHQGPFYLMTDDEEAITVLAAGDAAKALKAVLPEGFVSWDEEPEEVEAEVITERDTGDEQHGETE
tara:strand:- start:701 stop:1054 length:354 start_codon:yes stop_codon:yes gene_type:complete